MDIGENGYLALDLLAKIPPKFNPVEMMGVFQGNTNVKSIDL